VVINFNFPADKNKVIEEKASPVTKKGKGRGNKAEGM
jgi:hypothetical protein